MNKLFLAITLLFLQSASAQSDPFTISYTNPKTGLPAGLRFNGTLSGPSLENTSQWFRTNLNSNAEFTLKYRKANTDKSGMTHYRYDQYFKGFKIEGAEIILHTKNNQTLSLNGRFYPQFNIDTKTVLTSEEALNNALGLYPQAVFMWEVKAEENLLKSQTGNANSTYRPIPELVIISTNDSCRNSDFRMAYKMSVYVHTPLSHEIIYVDAVNGEILDRMDQICTIDKVGVAHTKYSGIRSINCDSIGSDSFILNDITRGQGILTIDARVISVTDSFRNFLDSNNIWNNVNVFKDEVATDVHWGTEVTYDFYKDRFGRNGYDDSGTKVISKVHIRNNYNNAFWDGKSCNYGDGDGIKYMPLTSLDICAHELTHGVTQHTAQLVYRKESGALNESFSDILAKGIQYANDTAKFTWMIADQIVIGTAKPFRDLSMPNSYLHPKYYYGKHYYTGNADNGGVHTNSGVQNFWYYLLAKGGTGKREDNQNYIVNALGFDKANDIAYTNLSSYLTSSSEYIDACYGSLDAARALYGETSSEAKQVERAWFAVGVLDFVSINSNKKASSQWTVLPNPGAQQIELYNPLNFENNDFEMFDLTGKQVLKGSVKSSDKIDVTALQQGMYFIRINGSVLKWVKS